MIWKFGDNINTDLITPGRYNITTDPKELAKIAFIELRPEFSKQVKPGDFVVGGKNFGCGSSRETAATALKYTGIAAVLAKSFARIFYRNALNLGLLLVIADTDQISETDILTLDTEKTSLVNETRGISQKVEIPPLMLKMYQEGGMINFIKQHGKNFHEEIGKIMLANTPAG